MSKMHFLGPCDRLRQKSPENEARWHAMMAQKRKITFPVFARSVDMTPLLDDGEGPTSYMRDLLATDPTTAVYKSVWGDKPCMFLQSAGFEFIFAGETNKKGRPLFQVKTKK